MDSGKAIFLLASTLTLILSILGQSSAKPASGSIMDPLLSPEEPSHYQLHPVDNCIFACDHCFKEESLVKCANDCILTEAVMSIEWLTTCPYLARQYTHSRFTNPIRRRR